MSEVTTVLPNFGTGIYSFSEAARILVRRTPGARVETLRRWVCEGLAPATFGTQSRRGSLLSFHDLVSLEVVRRFRDAGVSLQRLRKLEQALRKEMPDADRPFAHRLFFTDGAAIWAELSTEDGDKVFAELVGKRANQYVWRPVIESFAREIRFDDNGHAVAWQLSKRIEIDPRVQFGEPVVKGTRLPISVIARELAGSTPEQVADWHAVDVEDVQDVRDFVAA